MMEGVRSWLLTLIAVSVLCALADSLMPAGAVKQVGKLVCGLVILCAVLSPVAGLDLEGGRDWLEDYFAGLEVREGELKEQVDQGMKPIIEQEYAAYIVDKAARLGVRCTAKVSCGMDENGLYLPWEAEVTGAITDVQQSRLTQAIEEELGVPMERQHYHSGEGAP